MNNSVKKCVICNNDKIGEFITINDKKYHLCCIEQLQNNWNELKKWLEEYKEYCELEIKKGIALHTYDELDRNKRYGDITTCLYKVFNKMKNLEKE